MTAAKAAAVASLEPLSRGFQVPLATMTFLFFTLRFASVSDISVFLLLAGLRLL